MLKFVASDTFRRIEVAETTEAAILEDAAYGCSRDAVRYGDLLAGQPLAAQGLDAVGSLRLDWRSQPVRARRAIG